MANFLITRRLNIVNSNMSELKIVNSIYFQFISYFGI